MLSPYAIIHFIHFSSTRPSTSPHNMSLVSSSPAPQPSGLAAALAPGGAPRAPAEAVCGTPQAVCGTPRVPAMSDVKKKGGESAGQAAVAASEVKAEMHKCNAFRARFRVVPERQRIPVNMLVPHPENRNGVFPSSARVRHLACELIILGFSQAEADFEGVCVREYSAEELKNRTGYKSFRQNMVEKAKGCIHELYQHRNGEALYGTLSHTHLSAILRAISAGVQWEIPVDELTPDQLKQLEPYKDKNTGLLLMSAVADKDEVAKKLVTEGMLMDVLDARIMHEEPTACNAISTTLNKPQAFAMRMSEVQVLKALSREINNLKEDGEVTFEAVMKAKGAELGPWTSDPSFLDFFNFILNLGADGGPHIGGLITFVESKVNSSRRALRLSAFAQVGEIKTAFPRVKVALIMRAYRLPAKKAMVGAPGWCPEPEASFKKPQMEPQLRLMEDLLHQHYVTLRSGIVDLLGGWEDDDKKTPRNAPAVDGFLTNVSIQCAGQMSVVSKMNTPTEAKTREALLLGCRAAYKVTFEEADVTTLMQRVKAKHDWFDFATLPASTNAKAAAAAQAKAGEAESKPRVITFNEVTGVPENEQATNTKEDKEKGEWLPLPLCEWLTLPLARDMSKKEAYMGAVVQVLREKHVDMCEMGDQYEEHNLPLAIQQHTLSNHIRVISRAAVAARKLEIWPCVPKAARVASDSNHPDKVLVQVWDRSTEEKNKTCFFLNPEFTAPAGSTAADVEESDPLQRAWTWTGKETMHPFWCVTKMTDETLPLRNLQKDGRLLRFNLTTTRKEVNMVKCQRVLTVSIPVITKTDDIDEGEELVMQVQPREKKRPAGRDWRANQKKNMAAEKAPSEPKANFDSTGTQAI